MSEPAASRTAEKIARFREEGDRAGALAGQALNATQRIQLLHIAGVYHAMANHLETGRTEMPFSESALGAWSSRRS